MNEFDLVHFDRFLERCHYSRADVIRSQILLDDVPLPQDVVVISQSTLESFQRLGTGKTCFEDETNLEFMQKVLQSELVMWVKLLNSLV